MIIELTLAMAVCHGGVCPARTVEKTVEKTKTVLVQRDVQPVRKLVAKVKTRHILRRK